MGNEALETLLKQYTRGDIAKPEYRQRRKDIINQATGFVEPVSPEQSPSNVSLASGNILLKVGVISAIVVGAVIVISLL
jgi:hypothetical protein